jgi:hydrogenase-4 component F
VLHALNNGLAKGLTFLAVGNVVLTRGTSVASEIRGLLRTFPATGVLLIAGLFAITGSPPFGLFISEFTILSGAFGERHAWIGIVVILLLMVIFVGIAAMILEMAYGVPDAAAGTNSAHREGWLVVAPAVLGAIILILGLYIPAPLREALSRAAADLGGRAP